MIVDKITVEGGVVDLYHVCSRRLYVWFKSGLPLSEDEIKSIHTLGLKLKRAQKWVDVEGDFWLTGKKYRASGGLLTL